MKARARIAWASLELAGYGSHFGHHGMKMQPTRRVPRLLVLLLRWESQLSPELGIGDGVISILEILLLVVLDAVKYLVFHHWLHLMPVRALSRASLSFKLPGLFQKQYQYQSYWKQEHTSKPGI